MIHRETMVSNKTNAQALLQHVEFDRCGNVCIIEPSIIIPADGTRYVRSIYHYKKSKDIKKARGWYISFDGRLYGEVIAASTLKARKEIVLNVDGKNAYSYTWYPVAYFDISEFSLFRKFRNVRGGRGEGTIEELTINPNA